MNKVPTFEQTQKVLELSRNIELARWKYEVLGSWQWWLKIGLLVLPWVFWLKFVDRSRLRELMLYGFFVFAIALLFDEMGTENLWWAYKYRTVPYMHILIPYDFAVLPVIYMLVYQHCRSWKKFLLVHTVIAALFAFVCENILQYMGIYVSYKWEHIYSFPIYILIAVFVRLVVTFILRVERNAKKAKEAR